MFDGTPAQYSSPRLNFERDGFYIFRSAVDPLLVDLLRTQLNHLTGSQQHEQDSEYIGIVSRTDHQPEHRCSYSCGDGGTCSSRDWRTCRTQYLNTRRVSLGGKGALQQRARSRDISVSDRAVERLLFQILPGCVAEATGWTQHVQHSPSKKRPKYIQHPHLYLFNEHFVNKPPGGGAHFLVS